MKYVWWLSLLVVGYIFAGAVPAEGTVACAIGFGLMVVLPSVLAYEAGKEAQVSGSEEHF